MKKILLGLTTAVESDWRERIKEASRLKIREVSLFLTGVSRNEREDLYALLDKSTIKSIPHIHLRHDMSLDEMGYLIKKFGTKAFNIHPRASKYVFPISLVKYSSMIFVENSIEETEMIPRVEELEEYGGLCIDFSHWEDGVLCKRPGYNNFFDLVKKYKIGCSHISAISNKSGMCDGILAYDSHYFRNLQEFNYIKKYKKYLVAEFNSLELTNSFEEQLVAKDYLEKIIA